MEKRAKLRCMHLLEKRDYTEKELRDKLRTGKTSYTEEEIETAISYVKGFHYVDDSRYADRYISCMSSRKSKKQIEMELLRKGVDRQRIQDAFEEADEIDEEDQIMQWIRKKNFDPATSDLKEKQRMYGFLMRKGFSADKIHKAMQLEFG